MSSHPPRVRIAGFVAGAILLAEAVILGVIITRMPVRLMLPVTTDLGGDLAGTGRRIVLTHVDIGLAVVVLCALVGLARMLSARASASASGIASASERARWVEFAFTSSITVFLVAQLNGISDVGTLVLIYATTSAITLFSVLRGAAARQALSFGAAVGIVPWGVIAFHQIGAAVIGDPLPIIVPVITLAMLAAAILFAVTQWREHGWMPRAELVHIVLSTVATSVFAWLVVLGVA